MTQTLTSPVFIVGPSRSGTSLLYRTLMLHSSFEVGEMCLAETGIFKWSLHADRIASREISSLYRYMLKNDSEYESFINEICQISKVHKLSGPACHVFRWLSRKFSWWPGKKVPLSVWRLLGGKHVIQKFFSFAQKSRGSKRLVEKTPGHLHYLDRVLDTYPHSKIIVTSRHPIDIFTSYRRRNEVEGESFGGISVSEFIKQFKNDTSKIRKYKESSQTYLVKYEDFTRKTKDIFQKVCSFVDVEFETDPIEGGCDALSHWDPDPYLSEPITPSTKNWKNYISKKDALFIENSLNKEMSYLDYENKIE